MIIVMRIKRRRWWRRMILMMVMIKLWRRIITTTTTALYWMIRIGWLVRYTGPESGMVCLIGDYLKRSKSLLK